MNNKQTDVYLALFKDQDFVAIVYQSERGYGMSNYGINRLPNCRPPRFPIRDGK